MSWKTMTIGKKIGTSFFVLCFILAIVSLTTILGIDSFRRKLAVSVQFNHLSETLLQRKIDHLIWANNINIALTDKNNKSLNVQTDYHQCAFGKWYYSDERKQVQAMMPHISSLLDQIEAPHTRLHESAHEIQECLQNPDRDQAIREATEIYAKKTALALTEVQKILDDIVQTNQKAVAGNEAEMISTASRIEKTALIMSIIALVIGILLALFIGREITSVLASIIKGLTTSAEQVTSAAEQISSSSQQIADGASTQASSLEEISSSMEEMTSMTKQNAENTREANTKADQVIAALEKSKMSMTGMSQAIQKIKGSSDQTGKIVKTIDEIAFQTNLLALNAAVEAARAGEAGKGFAVVAEEVRNLARRSADAAKQTTSLIEESRVNANEGVKVSEELESILREIIEGVRKMAQLINEVTVASEEQAQGIAQINTALTELDNTTQAAAATAEETASASEQLSALTQELHEMVENLTLLISNTGTLNGDRQRMKTVKLSRQMKQLASTKHAQSGQQKKRSLQIVKPEQVIPFNDNDYEEF